MGRFTPKTQVGYSIGRTSGGSGSLSRAFNFVKTAIQQDDIFYLTCNDIAYSVPFYQFIYVQLYCGSNSSCYCSFV